MFDFSFLMLKAIASEIGPILPKYMVMMIMILPQIFKAAVRPLDNPTVAVALTVSYITSSAGTSVTADKSTVATKAVANDMLIIATDLLMASFGMVLLKNAYALHQNGRKYDNDNIDMLLSERYIAKKARMSKAKHHLKGPAKRTEEDDERFASSFRKLVEILIRKS